MPAQCATSPRMRLVDARLNRQASPLRESSRKLERGRMSPPPMMAAPAPHRNAFDVAQRLRVDDLNLELLHVIIKRSLESVVATWLAGLLLLLPLALTAAVLAWIASIANRLVGPGSLVGGLFSKVGYSFSESPGIAYLLGTLLLIVAIYLLGLVAQLGLRGPLKNLTGAIVRRIPLVGRLYSLADRFVDLLDPKQQETDLGAMSPVWCMFGNEGAAVLALAPSAETVQIEDQRYLAVLVPTAPVPFGGALIYVPAQWVRPASIGVDKLIAIYVSMGLTPPPAIAAAKR